MMNLKFQIKKRRINSWEREGQISKLVQALENERYDIKMLVVRALGDSRDKSVLPALFAHLNDYTYEFRLEVEKALLKLDPSSATIQQIKTLNEESVKANREKPANHTIEEIDKQLYSFKGRFNGNIQLTKMIKEMLKKPMRW
ncbi:MAG: hypothetical protein COW63_17155 [Bacteroidetes bacterium CG18_big_fil_WC_8_21_14_2_50_41_14]|nr:MAG: hypothetical protein COW63_17155 [Bacteroidetes bacterium CG18_big_fil_WC_8_21_14_2_50_41_14]PJB56839.1 MAG: hypothetical protein CO098_12815 [Bacteroidetes bacterium CG_4_9_14_3_um_filter_41_19]